LQNAVVRTGSRLKAGMTQNNAEMTQNQVGMSKNKAGMTTLTMEFGHLQTSQGRIKKLYFL